MEDVIRPKVLHVDDDKNFLILFSLTFKKWIDVTSAESGEAALEHLKNGSFDLIITDYEMPEMNGLELLNILRSKHKDIPVIFYTGQGTEEVARTAFLSGIFDYHVKDLRGFAHKERLLNSISRALEKKKVDLALEESQKIYKNLIESVPMGIFLFRFTEDKRLVLVDLNPASRRMIKDDYISLIGKPLEEVIPFSRYSDMPESLENIAATGKPWRRDYTFYDKNQIESGFEVFGFLISKDNIAVIFNDITDRKKLEEQTRQNFEHLNFILDSAPLGIVTIYPNSKFRSVNKAFCDMIGYSAEELLELYVKDVSYPDDYEKNPFEKIIENLKRKDKKLFEYEKRYVRKDGSLVNAIVHSSAYFDSNNEMLFGFSIIEDVTGKKKAEREIRESEERFRSIFDNSFFGIARTTIEGKVIYCNPANAQLFGYDSPDDFKNSIKDLASDIYISPARKEFMDSVIKTDGIYTGELILRRKNGEIVTVNMHTRAVRDEKGNPLYFDSFLEDITKQKEVKKELEENERRFRSFFDNANTGISCTTYEGKFLYANSAMAKIFGYNSVEDFVNSVNDVGRDLYVSPDRSEITSKFKPTMNLKGFEAKGRRKDGSVIDVALNVWASVNKDGEFICFDSIVEDITKRKQIERELRESEERYRSIFENSSIGIFRYTPEGRFILMNQANADILGYDSPEEMMNSIVDLRKTLNISQEVTRQVIKAASNDRDVARMEIDVRRKDGSTIIMSLNVRGVSNENGDLIYYEGFAEDITKKKILEQQMVEKNRELETFAYTISHELKSSVNIISQLLSFIEEDPKVFSEYYPLAVEQLSQMSEFVNRMLELSRAGKVIGEKIPVSPEPLIKKVFLFHKPIDIEAELEIQPPLPDVMGDYAGLELVFSNIIQNSIQNRDSKKDILRIVVGGGLKNGDAVLSFNDNGKGISENNIGRIFDIGYSESRKPGKGFGLAIIKKIIEAHGGGIRVESEGEGKGATFTVSLPMGEN